MSEQPSDHSAELEHHESAWDAPTNLTDFQPARYPTVLNLPPAGKQLLSDAAAAVRQEYRDSSRWKRLNAIEVSVFAERDRGSLYVIHLGKSIDFDWTWEGAEAFCPRSLDDDLRFSDLSYEEAAYDDDLIWSGEIVEVDQQHGCLYVTLDNPEATPKTGPFFVRPFEFLSVLDALYNDDTFEQVRTQLPARLNASLGDVHPSRSEPGSAGLPHLNRWWQHTWSILWGPPGTGKTWTTGQQIAQVLNDPQERVLIVSTTNQATDAVALSLGEAAKVACPHQLENETLLRIGKGASYQAFLQRGLESMLAGTEAAVLSQIDQLARQLSLSNSPEQKAFTRKRIAELRTTGTDQSRHNFVDPECRVVVSTAFKAISQLRDATIHAMMEAGEAPFTTVVIDEAGLISRSAVAGLSLLAARRIVLVGDSKQLAPISRISRVLPTRQQTWLASSGVSHLDEARQVPDAVHLLTQQHRMHPDVCNLVSAYQYDGVLATATQRAAQPSSLPAFLAKQSRTIWYVLDEEDCDLDALRASRGAGRRSWVRPISQHVLRKLFSNDEMRQTRGLFITPFKAQAHAANEWLADWRLNSWQASTVHSQQGSESDIVVFDTVNAGSHTWNVADWKRLVNVAISRAREAVVILASRAEMDEPYLRPLQQNLTGLYLVKQQDDVHWKAAQPPSPTSWQVADQQSPYHSNDSSRMGDQFRSRKSLRPLFSQEQQRLTKLKLDGKPRLVRGVAGSGKSVVLCHWLAKTAKRLKGQENARIWAVYANRSLHKLLCDSIEAAWELR